MKKIDLKKNRPSLYRASASKVEIIEVPALQYIACGGLGDPNISTEYQAIIGALFTLAYAIKFIIKKGPLGIDYGVMPLEGLYWLKDGEKFDIEDKSNWNWKLMIMQPEFVDSALFQQAMEKSRAKIPESLQEKITQEDFCEGAAAQILHVGPYAKEGPTIETLHSYIEKQNYSFNGAHHEIYLSDPQRAAQENLKTIIRQPVKAHRK